ncbi:hypothetical protein BSK47_20860 [Paenibacillus odorifer]|uniref:Uncharacterized protein n=1 Tax=Paenibacillus odorifer TaxID=189426 RepID=A0AB36JB89_9BACL|nr:hypothetical protein BSK47_20860 [Paenibacillus odorifer]
MGLGCNPCIGTVKFRAGIVNISVLIGGRKAGRKEEVGLGWVGLGWVGLGSVEMCYAGLD